MAILGRACIVYGQFPRINIKHRGFAKPTMLKATACVLLFLCCVLSAAEKQWAVAIARAGRPIPKSQIPNWKCHRNAESLRDARSEEGEWWPQHAPPTL